MSAQVAGKRPLGAVGRAGIVVGMHAAVLFVIAQGFVLKDKVEKPQILVGTVIDVPTETDPVPIVEPREFVPPIHVPAPVDAPIDSSPDVIRGEAIPEGQIIEPPPSGSALPKHEMTGVRQLANFSLRQPPYPPSARRQGLEGSTELEVYVLPNGRVGEVRVVKSAGFDEFDRSAMEEAKRSWRFAPATRDGEPFAQWHRLRVVFKLENAR